MSTSFRAQPPLLLLFNGGGSHFKPHFKRSPSNALSPRPPNKSDAWEGLLRDLRTSSLAAGSADWAAILPGSAPGAGGAGPLGSTPPSGGAVDAVMAQQQRLKRERSLGAGARQHAALAAAAAARADSFSADFLWGLERTESLGRHAPLLRTGSAVHDAPARATAVAGRTVARLEAALDEAAAASGAGGFSGGGAGGSGAP